jgi:hypothetical protein
MHLAQREVAAGWGAAPLMPSSFADGGFYFFFAVWQDSQGFFCQGAAVPAAFS